MNFSELLVALNLGNSDIIVTVVKPVRKDSIYKTGKVTGYKSGLWGGGHKSWKNGFFQSYCSLDQHWIKKPKVHVTYNIFEWGGKEHSDWIDVDNCTFEIVANEN